MGPGDLGPGRNAFGIREGIISPVQGNGQRQRIIPVKPIDSFYMGICDVSEVGVGNIGNALVLNSPVASTPFAGPAATTLWAAGPVIPPNATQTVLLQARAIAPGNPQSLVISLNAISTQEQTFTAFDADLKAFISFGIGNNRNIAIVDIAQGLQFSVIATNIEIRAVYALISAIGTVQPITAGAQIGYGGRDLISRPTFTGRFVDVIPGAPTSVNFVPPPFAREFYLSAIDQTTLGPTGATLTLTAGTNRLAEYVIAANDTTWRPIPNGTKSINILNTGANNITGTILFGLGL